MKTPIISKNNPKTPKFIFFIKPQENKKVIAFTLSPEVIKEIRLMSKKNKVSRSWIVESVLTHYLFENSQSKAENLKRLKKENNS